MNTVHASCYWTIENIVNFPIILQIEIEEHSFVLVYESTYVSNLFLLEHKEIYVTTSIKELYLLVNQNVDR